MRFQWAVLCLALSVEAAAQGLPRVAFVCAICDEKLLEDVSRRPIAEFEKAGFVSGRNVEFLLFARAKPERGVPTDAQVDEVHARALASKPNVIMPVDIYSSAAIGRVRDVPVVIGLSNVDAVRLGLVESMSRPGRNITGFIRSPENLDVKRLELLHEIAPRAKRIGVLLQEGLPGLAAQLGDVKAAGSKLKLEILEFVASPGRSVAEDVDELFGRMKRAKAEGFLLLDGNSWSPAVVEAAKRHRLPSVYPYSGPIKGGLASYNQVGKGPGAVVSYAVQILKGARAADLPVETGRDFALVLNEKAAREIGIVFPAALRLRATRIVDE